MAISYRGCSLGAEAVDAAGAVLSIQKDGSVYLYSGLAENGQGLKTVFCQIAAEELGVGMKRVTFLEANTSISPDSCLLYTSTCMPYRQIAKTRLKIRS